MARAYNRDEAEPCCVGVPRLNGVELSRSSWGTTRWVVGVVGTFVGSCGPCSCDMVGRSESKGRITTIDTPDRLVRH